MTKADLISAISAETGADKVIVKKVIESFTENVKKSLTNGKNVYLRGFGSFIIVKKAEKTARDIRKNKKVVIPEHYAPKFKPVKSFVDSVKENVK
ncbi:MAG: integration host factor subunit beta [Bacteroidales bacterium]|nr:integration host factor subunit beta [Bacteroidales bacterium]